MRVHARIARIVMVAWGAAIVPAMPAAASFHLANIAEIMTSYGGSSDVQFVEILMTAAGQSLVSGSKLNVFDAQGNFVATALTLSGNVSSGSQRPWIMGTPAFATLAGLSVDFAFPNGSLPTGGGMVCWGRPGTNPTPVACNGSGVPYVDCIAYGSYSGPTNTCIGTPTTLTPDGHGLVRDGSTHDNLADFACADPATPENNDRDIANLVATAPCGGEPTTTSTSTTTTAPTTSTIVGGTTCGDGNGDGDVTASDALVALRTAVGSGACSTAICDVDGSGSVTATDALLILKAAVGQDVALTCV